MRDGQISASGSLDGTEFGLLARQFGHRDSAGSLHFDDAKRANEITECVKLVWLADNHHRHWREKHRHHREHREHREHRRDHERHHERRERAGRLHK